MYAPPMTTVSIEGCDADEAIRTGCVRSLYYVVYCIMLGISESFVVMCGLRLGAVGAKRRGAPASWEIG
jgi:hypothetical protein